MTQAILHSNDVGGAPPADDTPDPVARAFARQAAGTLARRREFGLDARLGALDRLRTAILRNEAAIVAAVADDFGKAATETVLTEILPVLNEIRHTRSHLKRWMRPQRVGTSLGMLGTSARILPEPRGVCLVIAPWNYPFSLAMSPVVSAIAAGNSVILKPSEMSPATSAVLARIVAKAFEPDLATVVEGDREVATALLALPFDHIFFTGSPEIGKVVMTAAARNLTSVTLELGGKSPTIVGPGADLAQAARWIAFGKFANAGQTCIAPDHLFVHESVADRLMGELGAAIRSAYGSDASRSPDYARIINERHAGRLRGLLEDATAKGARIVTGGEGEGTYLAPTLIDGTTQDMTIDREEIFGPILPVMTFTDLDQLIDRIVERPKPLALYVFEKDRAFVERVTASVSAGGIGVNLTVQHYSHQGLPFGGVNNSGIGAAHGIHGFRAFSHEKPVLTNRFSALPMMFPPYTDRVRKLIGLARRFLG